MLAHSLPPTIVVMGVSGCGKTAVGKLLAERLGGIFDDGDDFHTPAAKAKMNSGTPLTDEDRRPWYALLRQRVLDLRGKTSCHVLACSALKEKYREWLRADDGPELMGLVHLKGDFELIHGRMTARTDHYMPASLLRSQFEALEPPTGALELGIEMPVQQLVDLILAHPWQAG